MKKILLIIILLIVGLGYFGWNMMMEYGSKFIMENSDEIVQTVLESIHNGELKESFLEDADPEFKKAVETHYDACVQNKYKDVDLPDFSGSEGMEGVEEMVTWITETIFMEIFTCISDKADLPLPE